MKKLRFLLALWAGKLATLLLRLLGRKATYFGGKLAIRLCPDFLARLGRPETVVGVTGTNGKTSVNNLIGDALSALGVVPVSNRYGSNINAGVASALLADATLLGRCRSRAALLELDERSARLIYPYLQPDLLLCTNLFRDSMRRNAHSEYIFDLLSRYIPAGTRLVLNADDPLSAFLAPQCSSRVYFGIDRQPWEAPARANIVQDARLCPRCGALLQYDWRRYNHIGRVHCPECGLASPEADYRAETVEPEAGRMTLRHGEQTLSLKLAGDAMYNVYNSVAVAAVLCELGYTGEQVEKALGSVELVRSRYWREKIGGGTLTVIMAKGLNAVACSRSFDYVSAAPGGNKRVVLMLDDVFDEKSGSENTAWLYDADFEFLADPSVRQIVAVGVRCLDTKLRLLLAGIEEGRIRAVEREEDAAAALELEGTEDVYLLYELYREARARRVRAQIAERMSR